MVFFDLQTYKPLNYRRIVRNSQFKNISGRFFKFVFPIEKPTILFAYSFMSEFVRTEISVAKLSPVMTFSILFVSLSMIKSSPVSSEFSIRQIYKKNLIYRCRKDGFLIVYYIEYPQFWSASKSVGQAHLISRKSV